MLFDEPDPAAREAQRTSPVAKAEPSPAAHPVVRVFRPRSSVSSTGPCGTRHCGAEPSGLVVSLSGLGNVRVMALFRVALLRFIHLGQPQRVRLVVADQLSAEPAGFLNDLGVMVADLAVQRSAGADAIPPRWEMTPTLRY
jgi:hypothetical protein